MTASRLGTCRLAILVLALLPFQPRVCRAFKPAPIFDAPEPTRAELLSKAKLDADKPKELVQHLNSLQAEATASLESWIPSLHSGEYYRLVKACRDLGYGELKAGGWSAELPGWQAKLAESRLAHPARLCDAILRQLEEKGTPDQIELLMYYASVQMSEWGRWKFYATVQGILARHSAAEVVEHNRLTPVLAMLLRDLTSAQRGSLATALWAKEGKGTEGPLQTALWLAWSLSSTDPEGALPIFRRGLESTDPALRLFAGLGIARISDAPIPYCLTSDRKTTEVARTAWLKGLKLRWADDWRFPDALVDNAARTKRGDALLVRPEDEAVLRVLPDGTPYAGRSRQDLSIALTNRDGEVLVRFPEGRYNCKDGSLESHGGFWALGDKDRQALEYAATGEKLWECPLINGHVSARFLAGAGPGRILLVRNNRVEILNRRGDVLWSVVNKDGADDPRGAYMVGPDTVLIAYQKRAELHHRTKGRLEQIGGPFHSLGEIRYHPVLS